jgi:membrane fusion protein, multidrug efflux system
VISEERTMKKKIITGAVVVVVLCAVLIPRLLGNKQFAQAVSPPVMEAEQPVMGDIRLTTSLIGKIEPSDVVYIYPKASGDVTAVNVKAGDIVAQGQVICTIDTKQVETAKSSMDSAGLSLKQAREELARQQILYSSGGISDQEYEQYRDNVTSAEISYNQAKYSYETQMEYSQITAPIDGLVEICDMEPYDTVSQSNLICVISGRGSRVVSFSATERIRGYLQEGDTIQVEKDGGSYQGTIYEISTMADETTGLYKVKASMDEDTFLSTGSEVKLYVTSEETTNAMTIPVDAVYYEDGEPYVYVYTDGKVHKRDIESGIYDSNTMEVRSGLTLDDQVVTTWSSEPYEGAEVILKNQEEDGQ